MSGVWLSNAQREALITEARRTAPLETGGVLLGYRAEHHVVVVCSIIGPGPRAVHRRTSFLPDHEYQEREIARIYEQSGRHWTYLGDWHSHPGGTPSLSTTDRRTLRRIARAPRARIASPLMLVVAGGDPWEIVAYQALPSLLRLPIDNVSILG